ncbi:Fe-S protein assembly chaperone HscA, partial [Acidithiobacillus caldus]|nr:Fe-S protein assembly chaperone HscA [Acidithiobacillus caldus]
AREALASALTADAALLADAERQAIEAARDDLDRALAGSDADTITAAMEALEKAAEVLVERRMNRAVRSAMAGHSIDEWKD